MIRSYVKPTLLEVDEEAIKKIEPNFKSDDSHLDREESKQLPSSNWFLF